MEIETKLLDFIAENFMVDREEIPLDKSLIDEGIIDSFGLVEIAAYMKKSHGFEVETEDMIRDNFGSVEKMVAYIGRRLAG
ncbi:MAG: acyl carrier protein [Spirochaetales bacterium]|nr:acyl carrier protein [Spirochaetales bacterium]